MKRMVLPILLAMSFSVKAMDDKKPSYPDPEISFPDPDVPYPDSSTADNRDKKVVIIDEEAWKRINALIDALDKSKPVRVALGQMKQRTAPINLVLAQTCGVSTSDRPIMTQFARLKLDESELQLVDSNEDTSQLTDGQGRVLGINTAGIAAAQTVGYRIPYGDEEGVLENSSSFEAFPDLFEKTPEDLRKIEFDFGNDQNMPEVIESCSVNFNSERTQIIAFCSRVRRKSTESITVTKDLETGRRDISTHLLSHDEDNAKFGRFGDVRFAAKPDKVTVLKLKQKIAEFEQNEKAKELKHENS